MTIYVAILRPKVLNLKKQYTKYHTYRKCKNWNRHRVWKTLFQTIQNFQGIAIPFDSILPSEIDDFDGDLVVTTEKEAPKQISMPMLFDEIISKDPIVVKGIITKMLNSSTNSSKLVLGIDPGQRIGVSVTYLENEIARAFFVSLDKLIPYLISILAELPAARKIVKIGNGDMKTANKILQMLNLQFCSKFEIEFVDESSTTLKIKNHNQRGKRDMLSAQFISQRTGNSKSILPLSITG